MSSSRGGTRKKERLDDALIGRGVFSDKKDAFVAVLEGRVLVNGQKAISPAQEVVLGAQIEMRPAREFVGRGAYKLKGALDKFGISVRGLIAVDVGSATGGFVDVLLQAGAKKVYAIDTARGKLALSLRSDPRVTVMEETDVRDCAALPECPDMATIDVSLISLANIMPAVARLIRPAGFAVALLKPQYEAEDRFLRHGVLQDAVVRESVRENFVKWAERNGWRALGSMESPIAGASGNREYLLYLKKNQ